MHSAVARGCDSVIRAALGTERRVIDLRFTICSGQVIVDDDAARASRSCDRGGRSEWSGLRNAVGGDDEVVEAGA